MNAPSKETTTKQAPKWAKKMVALRVPLLVVLALFTVAMAYSATHLRFNFSPDNLFVSDDPALEFFQEKLVPAFGDAGSTCIIAIEGDLTAEQTQKALVETTTALQAIEGTRQVASLVSVELPTEGALGYAPLFNAEGQATAEALRKAASDPNLEGLLLSRALDVTAVIATVAPLSGENAKARDVTVDAVISLSQKLAKKYPELTFHLAGVPVSHAFIVSTLQGDQIKFIPLLLVVMALLLWVSFRNLAGVVLPFIATGCAALWCVGMMAAVGHAINVVNNAIVVLLLVVGIADGVHLVERFLAELAAERKRAGANDVDKDEIIARTIAAMTLPCALTTATTAVGFLGALVAKMHLVREFGLDAALGVLGAFVATMVVVPALLGFLPLPAPERERKKPLAFIDRGLAKAAAFAIARPLALVLAFAAASVALVGGATGVYADQTLLSELPDGSPSKIALNLLEKKLAGVLPVEIVYEADDASTLKAPATLVHMAKLSAALERGDIGRDVLAQEGLAPIAPRTRALPDVYAAVGRAVGGELAKKAPTTWTDADVRQLQLLFELAPQENQEVATAGLIALEHSLARIIALLPDAGTQRFLPWLEALRQQVAKDPPPGVTIHISGGQVVATGAMETVSADMMSSVGLAFVLIFFFVTLLFRSPVVGLLALVPNALPVLATLAAMGWLGVPLRLATILTFCMALGVAVDACIHLLARLREERSEGHPLEDAVTRTMQGAGRPVVLSTVLLLGGFLVLGLSEFGGLRDFAILSAATLSCALVVDVLLLPALIVLVRPKFAAKRETESTS